LKNLLQSQRPVRPSIPQPRWVRVNRIKSSVAKQLQTTFAGYASVSALTEVKNGGADDRILHIDAHIPDLIALPAGVDLSKTAAYKNGDIILQDKSSCIPAYLLLGSEVDSRHVIGDIIDACAAPGNKTTHLASIVAIRKSSKESPKSKIFACERDPSRSRTLQKMINVAGASNSVTVLPEQDFLALNPSDDRFVNVTHLLLDPSCSGSGIVGREDVPVLALPEANLGKALLGQKNSRKRKRDERATETNESNNGSMQSDINEEQAVQPTDATRLEKLSNLQTRIIEHAFAFPAAKFVTYSTCSVHTIENEGVVTRAIRSQVATERGWRLLRREKQVEGLRSWQHRGVPAAALVEEPLSEAERQACIRCVAGTEDGTMGFFVCAFVRDEQSPSIFPNYKPISHKNASEEDWEGFSDT